MADLWSNLRLHRSTAITAETFNKKISDLAVVIVIVTTE
jgi:hypothetical protein